MDNSAGNQAFKELKDGLQRLVTNTSMLLGASHCSLAALEPGSKAWTILAASPQGAFGTGPFRTPVQRAVAQWVVLHRSSVCIENLATDPQAQALDAGATGALLCAPLLANQDVFGAIMVFSPSPGTFKKRELPWLEALADIAMVSIAQSRHMETVSQQTQQLTKLLDVMRALGSAQDTRRIFSITVAGIRRLVRCEEAVIFAFEAATEELCGVAGLGLQSAQLAERRIRLRDPQSVTAWVAQRRRPLLYSVGTRMFVGPVTDTLLAKKELALLAVPLVAQGQLWGVITLARPEPFEVPELRLMLNLSSSVAGALEHVASVGERVLYR